MGSSDRKKLAGSTTIQITPDPEDDKKSKTKKKRRKSSRKKEGEVSEDPSEVSEKSDIDVSPELSNEKSEEKKKGSFIQRVTSSQKIKKSPRKSGDSGSSGDIGTQITPTAPIHKEGELSENLLLY